MDATRKTQTVLRQAFTRALNDLSVIMPEDSPDQINLTELHVYSQILDDKNKDLESANAALIQCMLNDVEITPEEIDKEVTSNDEYKKEYLRVKDKVLSYLNVSNATSKGTASINVVELMKMKLPQIELKKFNGEPKEWLQFWSQFRKIHEDTSIDKEDKFQYLLQTMLPDSRAAKLVASFPPTGENYEKVITSLKNRFGRDVVLVEIYIRELLKLILQNTSSPQKKLSLAGLYDNIESLLRALESLEVTTDKCGAMLFPLVEASLSEDLLRAWQRYQGSSVQVHGLTQLINFLQSEVENEERMAIAMNGFDLQNEDKKAQKKKTGLKSRKVKGQGDQGSTKCGQARKMTLEEWKSLLRRLYRCLCCLKPCH